jgi:hypothetical protein
MAGMQPCDGQHADCDGDPTNGCETDLTTDAHHCGACAMDCDATVQHVPAGATTCNAGQCDYSGACASPFGDCDGDRTNGCETSVDTNSHCGACTTACSGAQVCLQNGCNGASAVFGCQTPASGGSCVVSGDTDGDGLLDVWEAAGYIDLNCNGKNDGDGVDVQLPGADPMFPDVYLEIDYMQQAGSGATCTVDGDCSAVPGEQCVGGACTHTHQPKMSSLMAVKTAATRGLPSDTTRPGFYLHYDLAHMDAIAEVPVVSFGTDAVNPTSRVLDPACVGPSAVDFFDLKDAHYFQGPAGKTSAYASMRRRVYHYAIFGHYSTCPPDNAGSTTFCNVCNADRGLGSPKPGATGTAETPGNDFIVSLGGLFFGFTGSAARPRSDVAEGGTLLHELGHNLGLGHGVTQTGAVAPSANGPLFSPIYFSVMNYNYQTRGVLMASANGGATPATSKIDFSDLTGCADLNEASLDESVGAGCAASTNYVLAYYADAGGAQKFATAQSGTAIDWNGNGTIEAAATDNLNSVVSANSTDVFRSLNDWAYDPVKHQFTTLQFAGGCWAWTLLDGLAPAAALSTGELTSTAIVRSDLDRWPPVADCE